ncbi:AMP-binding protein [Dyella flagellata]|uniref:AMP-dependent synthetase/ligase domain-containing protein n=1 Tax=Dyella flagellata TaxID=1867833 RepID=A0ABQ5XB80_9GAMM|nr:AMP-binding protein [Dyella flagellata]GLQ88542.1 hypothetical protein GCM10007898_21120 [Dyella flagellata]
MTFATELERFGDRVAVQLASGEAYSYRELALRADSLFAPKYSGLVTPNPIAIECSNAIAPLAAYLGALRHRVPALLIDSDLDEPLREQLFARYDIGNVFRATGSWHQRAPDQHSKANTDLALLLSTSGSTGGPKLVRLSLDNLQANAEAIAKYLQLSTDDRPITSLPMHYSYGLSVINSHLLVGAPLLLTPESVTTRGFWNFFKEFGATSFSGVPTTYAMLKQMRFERMDLPSLRVMTQAGGRLAPDLVKWFGELAKVRQQRFFVMYGQTEATARISYVPPEHLLDKLESIGIAIPGGALELIGEGGEPIAEPDSVGELCYTGPNVMMGYALGPDDLALPDMQHGRLRTGDLAKRDRDGYFYIVGRLKRFIKVFGNRIGLDEIEHQLREDGFDAAVTGKDDLLVVAVRGEDVSPDDLAHRLSARYRIHKSAIRVRSVASFPLSSSGKVLYMDLLNELRE